MKKIDFIAETKYLYNTIKEVNGLKIAVVGWHSKPWKLVETLTFDTVSDRSYEPIASFKTREDFWQYLKANQLV